MNRFFRQVTGNPEKAETITVEWAVNTAADYADQIGAYIASCATSEDAGEREKYMHSALDALGHMIIANQMVGALTDPDVLAKHLFGDIPVEIVEEG